MELQSNKRHAHWWENSMAADEDYILVSGIFSGGSRNSARGGSDMNNRLGEGRARNARKFFFAV